MKQPKQIGPESVAAGSQALTKKYASPSFSGCANFNASRPALTMRMVLDRFNIKYKNGKADTWQPVKCGKCGHHEAWVMLHGKHGHSGGYRCNKCGTRGSAIKIMAAFMGLPEGVVRGML